jgi:hypothetical protein
MIGKKISNSLIQGNKKMNINRRKATQGMKLSLMNEFYNARTE